MKKTAVLICVIIVVSLLAGACASAGGETALEYKGYKISEAMYGYWSARFKKNILYSYNNNKDTQEFWNSEVMDGITAEKYFTDIINDQIYKYCIGLQLFDEYGLKLDPSVKEAIDEDINEKIEYYGSRAALNSVLAGLGLNINLLRDIYLTEEKLNAVYRYLFGEGGPEALTDEEYIQYFKDNYWHIKYIVIYTTKLVTDSKGNYKYDSDGSLMTEDLTEEELAAKLAKADEALEKARAGEDFDELIKAYSEYDTSAYPNGFYLSVNEISTYGSEIIAALPGMKAGDVARIDEESSIFIIKKLELPDWNALGESDLVQLADLEDYAKSEKFEAKMSALYSEVKANSEILDKYRLSELLMISDSNL